MVRERGWREGGEGERVRGWGEGGKGERVRGWEGVVRERGW